MIAQPILSTPRLALRPFLQSDASRVQELAGAPEIADTTLHIPHPYPDGAAEEWIAKHPTAWLAGSGVAYAMTNRSSGELLGAIGMSIVPDHARAEAGYWVGVPFWSRGYCTEAAAALFSLGFTQLGLNRIEARHLIRNPASGRVMQKLGMRLEGVQRQSIQKSGRFEDIAMYAILAAEWRPPAYG